MPKITKAVIPVAGYGTRFLPATKAQPKEMLTIVDKPVIQYIVEEAVSAGITDIILVTGIGKRAVEDHFDHNLELYNWLKQSGKDAALDSMRHIAEMANFIYIRQKGPYGNGTAVLNAKKLVGNEPFALLWGDDMFYGKRPRLAELIEAHEKYGAPILTACRVTPESASKYGILDASEIEPRIHQVKQIVEKPAAGEAPSNLATVGGYIFTPDIFDELENTPIGRGGELWLTDAASKLLAKRPFYACEVEAKYYDVGSKLGWLQANVDLALLRDDLSGEFKQYLKGII